MTIGATIVRYSLMVAPFVGIYFKYGGLDMEGIICYLIAYKKKNGSYSIHSQYTDYWEARKKYDWMQCHRKRDYELLAVV